MEKSANPNSTIVRYQENWQKKAEQPNRLSSQERVYKTLKEFVENILNREFKGRMLDVGSGDGSLITILNLKPNISATGIDIDQGVNFESDKLPFKSSHFDIAIMYSVIEHLYDPGNLLTEIRRVLKKQGILIIITPNFDLSNFAYCERDFYRDPTHVHPYSSISLKHLMKLHKYRELFIGLWTVNKSPQIWKLPMRIQFYLGGLLPFYGTHPWAPDFLKGRSKTILSAFKNTPL